MYREDELNTGDMLMIARNNYYWTEKSKEMDFIANGEIAVVRRVRRTRELYDFRFAEVVRTMKILSWKQTCCWIPFIQMLRLCRKQRMIVYSTVFLKIMRIFLSNVTV